MNVFDFSKLPNLVGWSAAVDPLDKSTREEFKKYPRAYGRYISSVRFIVKSKTPPDTPGDEFEIMQKAYLRASLSDFKTIMEVLRLDIPDQFCPDIHVFQNPLFSFLSEIRNQIIHFYSPNIEATNTHNVKWIGDQEFPFTVYGLELVKSEFLAMKNVKKFWSDSDAERIFDWFEVTQNEYGFREIVLQSNLQLARDIVAKFG